MNKLSILAPISLVLVLAACEEKSSAPQATVAPAATTAAPAASAPQTTAAVAPASTAVAAVAAGKFAITSDTSKIEWTGAKITGKHEGSFKKFTGSIELPASGKLEEGKVTLEIDTGSLNADQEKLTGHLKSPEFFDAVKFPMVKFTSTTVVPGGANGATHTVTGNLDLHGISKSVSFPAKITVAGDTVSATSEFQLNRQDFGLKYPGKPDDLIKDNVTVKLDVKAKKGT